jgi:hypothetical protein
MGFQRSALALNAAANFQNATGLRLAVFPQLGKQKRNPLEVGRADTSDYFRASFI